MTDDLNAAMEALKAAMEARVDARDALRKAVELAAGQLADRTLVGDCVTVKGTQYVLAECGWWGTQCEGDSLHRSGDITTDVLLADGKALSVRGRLHWFDGHNQQDVCRNSNGAYFYEVVAGSDPDYCAEDDEGEIFVATWSDRVTFMRDLPEIIQAFHALHTERTANMTEVTPPPEPTKES